MSGMKSMHRPSVGLDLDGTILAFDANCEDMRPNHDFLAYLQGRGVTQVAVCTNQGGLSLGGRGGVRHNGLLYPTIHQFLARAEAAWLNLKAYGILLYDLRVSLYHPRSRQHEIDAVYVRLLSAQRGMPGMSLHLYRNPTSRKPRPQMLLDVGGGSMRCFYGDSDDDEGAAVAAGIEFVRVPRFV